MVNWKDSPTRSALPLATEGTQERPENDGESGKFCRSLLFEHELHELNEYAQMIVEYKDGQRIVSHNSIDDQIADAEYYLTCAQIYGSMRTRQKWRKRLRELRELKDKQKEL